MRLDLKQILAMPLSERHQYLKQFIPAMLEDFLHDPELTEFNVLDTEYWDLDDYHKKSVVVDSLRQAIN